MLGILSSGRVDICICCVTESGIDCYLFILYLELCIIKRVVVGGVGRVAPVGLSAIQLCVGQNMPYTCLTVFLHLIRFEVIFWFRVSLTSYIVP